MPSTWIYDRMGGAGTPSGPAPLAPNLASILVPTVNYVTKGGLPRWYLTGNVTLPAVYADIKRIHIVIPGLPELLAISASQFGSATFPLAGLVLSYTTPDFERDTVTWNYTAEFWVENADGIWTPSPPTAAVTVTGTAAPFGGTSPPAPAIPNANFAGALGHVIAIYQPYGNLWEFGVDIQWTTPSNPTGVNYFVRLELLDASTPARKFNIDTVAGPFTDGTVQQLIAIPSYAVPKAAETWNIRATSINPDNVATGPPTDVPFVVQPATLASVAVAEVGPRTNVATDADPTMALNRGLLTTIKVSLAVANNPGGSTGVQQIVVWFRYDRGDKTPAGAAVGPVTLLQGAFGVTGSGPQDFFIPNVWLTSIAAGVTFTAIAAIWAADPSSMQPPAVLTGANSGSFPNFKPNVPALAAGTASVDYVSYPAIPGGFAWAWHRITVTSVPFDDPNFKAIEFTVQKYSTTGIVGSTATPANDYEGVERNFAGSGASQTAYLQIEVDWIAKTVKVTLLTAWTMPDKASPDRRFVIRVKNVFHDNSKVTATCWSGSTTVSAPGPSSEITYWGDRMEIVPDPNKAGLSTGALSLAFSGADTNVGVAYNGALAATGGTLPYTFSILSGSLPTGLSLNSATGAITGSPTTAGTYTFAGKVTDSTGAVASTPVITIVVAAAGTQVGLSIAPVTGSITSYQTVGNAQVPVFSGTFTVPTGSPNIGSLAAVWVSVIDPSGKEIPIQSVTALTGPTGFFSGMDSSIQQAATDQSPYTIKLLPVNASGIAIGSAQTVTGLTVKGTGNAGLGLIPPGSVSITEPAPGMSRYQNPPGGNTYTYVRVQVNYAMSQTNVPIYTIWHSFDGGVTKKWVGSYQGQIGATSVTVINFFIPLGSGTNNYSVFVAAGFWNGDYTTTPPAGSLPVQSNPLTVVIGGVSVVAGVMSITNISGALPAADGSNIFMGTNNLGNPYAEVIVKCATPGNSDTAPYFYSLWVKWTNSTGAVDVNPGGVANSAGWRKGDEFGNDGTTHQTNIQINYPTGDYYLKIQCWGRTRNSSLSGSPPFAGDPGATLMQWPGGATEYILHVGLPPGPTNTGDGTIANTNIGMSILSDPSFEFSKPGVVMTANTKPGPGWMPPAWDTDLFGPATAKLEIMSGTGHSGAQWARLSGPNAQLKQGFSIQPSQPIYFQAWFQSSNTGGAHACGITIYFINAAGGLITSLAVGSVSAYIPSWQLVSLIVQASSVPSTAATAILVFQNSSSEPAASYWEIDDVIVQQVVQQINQNQTQTLGANTLPVGPHQLSLTTAAYSYLGLDALNIVATDVSQVVLRATPGQASASFQTGGGSSNGFLFFASSSGTTLSVTHAGTGRNGRTFTLRDGLGVDHIVWDGIIVS